MNVAEQTRGSDVAGAGQAGEHRCVGVRGQHGTHPWAYTLPVVGMAGLVVATLLENKTRLGTPLGDALVIQCTASAVLFGLLALATGQAAPPIHDGSFWAAVTWFIVLSTMGAMGSVPSSPCRCDSVKMLAPRLAGAECVELALGPIEYGLYRGELARWRWVHKRAQRRCDDA